MVQFNTNEISINGTNCKAYGLTLCSVGSTEKEILTGLNSSISYDTIGDYQQFSSIVNNYQSVSIQFCRADEYRNLHKIDDELMKQINRWLFYGEREKVIGYRGFKVKGIFKSSKLEYDNRILTIEVDLSPIINKELKKKATIKENGIITLLNTSNINNGNPIEEIEIEIVKGNGLIINNLTNGKNFVIENLSQGMKFKLLPRLRFVYGEDIFNNISTRDWETFILDLGINKLEFIGEEININILFNNELALM